MLQNKYIDRVGYTSSTLSGIAFIFIHWPLINRAKRLIWIEIKERDCFAYLRSVISERLEGSAGVWAWPRKAPVNADCSDDPAQSLFRRQER